MRIAVFGADGMLGKALAAEAAKRGHGVMPVGHGPSSEKGLWISGSRAALDISRRDHIEAFAEVDGKTYEHCAVWINAAGIIPPAPGKPARPAADVAMVMTNSVGPQVLADRIRESGYQHWLLHVSTDCVFSGMARVHGPAYSVDSTPDPADLYGRSKLVGESILVPEDTRVTVVRTSFIGFEHGLLRWLIDESLAGRTVLGWRNAWWSGSTVYAVARGLLDMAQDPPGGIAHLTTAAPISKAALLMRLREAFGFRGGYGEVERPVIYRKLAPTHLLEPVEDAIGELVKLWPYWKGVL